MVLLKTSYPRIRIKSEIIRFALDLGPLPEKVETLDRRYHDTREWPTGFRWTQEAPLRK